MSLINTIADIVKEFIIGKYNDHLKSEQLLMIENDDLYTVIANVYNENNKTLKMLIRERLKRDMGSEYPSGSVENIIFDLFQDREININRMVMEIDEHQKRNYCEIVRDLIGGGGLGINVSIDAGFCHINGLREDCQLHNMEIVEKYRYLYSINGIALRGESEYVVKVLQDNMLEKGAVIRLGLYGLCNDVA
jgi:hypothetical protein